MISSKTSNAFRSIGCMTTKKCPGRNPGIAENIKKHPPCIGYFKTPLLLRTFRSLGIINTESTQSPPLECVQSICFMENLTSVAGSESVTINSPTL
ncbi:hypothetical protein OIU78_002966 [Salix suchowensis]|nr:hypothetical protein OIU78_002966 [Salix suchowensis]